MKITPFLIVGISVLILSSSLSARTWTSNDGKTIQADIVSVNTDKITLKFKGREVKLPISRLSEDDQKFIKEWQNGQEKEASDDSGSSPTKSEPGEITLAGSTLKMGGATNTIEHPVSEDVLKEYSKASTQPTYIKIAIALPKDFDPEQAQKVVWVSAPINNEKERTRGNTGAMRAYAKTAVEAGWVAISIDLDIGNPRRPDADNAEGGDAAVHAQVIELLAETWPGFRSWQFACSGGSGGAKVSFFRTGQLLASELNVIGMFLAGCNQNLTEDARKASRYKKSDLRKIKVWISNGTKDTVSTVDHAESMEKGLKGHRYGKVRLELFEGGHVMKREEFKKSLDWFCEPNE